MNIVFLSNRSRVPWAGPYYSIPAQVRAQSKIDNVLWINENRHYCEEWENQNLPFLNLRNVPGDHLNDLPTPFNHPDIVVIEEIYVHRFSRIIADVQKAKIPYIIIPRSQLTIQGQRRKPLKKWLGNFIYYNQIIRRATAIQYLTKQEQLDSGTKWNRHSFIIPNGINLPVKKSKTFSRTKINAIYIGRIEKYQKGLDVLLQAINLIQNELRSANFSLTLYGPDQSNSVAELTSFIKDYRLQDIVSLQEALFNEAKSRVLEKSDIFIMSSLFEGLPMGLIEALSYSLPCLVSTGTNMRDAIEKYNAGWGADNTVESLVNALKQMLAQRDLFMEKSLNAYRLAEQYDWNEIAKRSHQIYEQIIGENNE